MASEHLTVPHLSLKDLQRIFSKIRISSDLQHNGMPCWIWNGYCYQGYGYLTWHHRPYRAHRFVYAWLVHSLPKNRHDYELDHLCRHRSCVNPCHLEVVTTRINHQRGYGPDAINSRKTHCDNGHAFTNKSRVCKVCQCARNRKYGLTPKGRQFKDRCNEKRKSESPERRAQRNQQRRERYARHKEITG